MLSTARRLHHLDGACSTSRHQHALQNACQIHTINTPTARKRTPVRQHAAVHTPAVQAPAPAAQSTGGATDCCSRRRALLAAGCLVSTLSVRPAYSQQQAADSIRRDYNRYSKTYDELDGGPAADVLGFTSMRQELLSRASGQVLEVGVGTGLNLPLYRWSPAGGVTELTAADISEGMLQQARGRVAGGSVGGEVQFVQADVAALPFQDESFDCVVDTFSLCVYPDPAAALREMARVLRPGGRLLLAAHVRSGVPLLGAYQDLTAGAVAATGKGCVWNQDVAGLVRGAGLDVQSVEPKVAGLLALVQASKGVAGGTAVTAG